jgi:hypothetical protein
MPFRSRHSDIESLSSGIIRLLVAEFYSQRVLIRDRFSLFDGAARFFEPGRGG